MPTKTSAVVKNKFFLLVTVPKYVSAVDADSFSNFVFEKRFCCVRMSKHVATVVDIRTQQFRKVFAKDTPENASKNVELQNVIAATNRDRCFDLLS